MSLGLDAMSAWATDAFNLLLQRLDRGLEALERIADSLETMNESQQ